jgi:hypothetical protein
LGYVALGEDARAAGHPSEWAAGEKSLEPTLGGSETLGNFGHGMKGGRDVCHSGFLP